MKNREAEAFTLSFVTVAKGRTGESRSYFNEIIARNPGHVEAHQFVALLDGSLAGPRRTALCVVVRGLAPHAASDATAAAESPCP